MSESAPVVVFTDQRTLWDYRHLVTGLASRDIRARYRQSFLGIYWSVLNPLLQTAVMAWVLVRLLKAGGDGGLPYVVLYFSGIAWWNFFTTAITGAMGSVASQVYLLDKQRFPVGVLPMAAILARAFDLAIAGIVLVVLSLWFGTGLAPTTWLIIPMAGIAGIATIGLGLLVAGLNVLYRDVSQVVNLVFTLGFFLTPVMYDVGFVPEKYRSWLLLNPIATAIHGTRAGMFSGIIPPLGELLPGTVVAGALLVVGIVAFRRLQATFTEVL